MAKTRAKRHYRQIEFTPAVEGMDKFMVATKFIEDMGLPLDKLTFGEGVNIGIALEKALKDAIEQINVERKKMKEDETELRNIS